MATQEITLPIGLTVVRHKDGIEQEVTHRQAVVRSPTTADLIESGRAAEQPVQAPDGSWHLATSPTLVGAHLLARQIVRIGDIEGPFEFVQLLKLELEDFNALQAAAEQLDAAAASARQRLAERGRPDPASA